ncbi:MAG: PocR ligand-binding domain-containing protein [Lachnospiraceae bacterium]|nr:PocR ligand-binding domain-containing protein [Lachnospiraceae bacterium]
MKIFDYVSKDEFQQLQNLFSDTTGMAAIALDSDDNFITDGSNFPEFWIKFIKMRMSQITSQTGSQDMGGGLMIFSYDLTVAGEKVGKMIGGVCMSVEPDDEKLRSAAAELRVDADKFSSEAKRLPIHKEKTIRSAGELLHNMMNQVLNGAYYNKSNSVIIEKIKPQIESATASVTDITERAKKLKEIASKQNILTLNASIEAARAGTLGAGFAVVAHQMGEMSKSSAVIYGDIEKDTDALKESIGNINSAFVKK